MAATAVDVALARLARHQILQELVLVAWAQVVPRRHTVLAAAARLDQLAVVAARCQEAAPAALGALATAKFVRHQAAAAGN